jgi:hypothetical protein
MDAVDDSMQRPQGEELSGSDIYGTNYKLFQIIRTSPSLAEAYRNLDMLDILWQVPFLVHRYPSRNKKTHQNDVKWWNHLKATKGWKIKFCKDMDDPCECRYMVACETQPTLSGKVLRVVGLKVSSVMALTKLADASLLMSLPLKIRSIALSRQTRLTQLESRSLCRALKSIPSLRSLNMNTHLREECVLPQLHGFEFSNAERLTPPNAFSYVCKFENLRSLEILARLTALPSCIGNTLGGLLRLDVRGNDFGHGGSNIAILPDSFGKLTNMVDFVGFGQSAQKCPPGGNPMLSLAAAKTAGAASTVSAAATSDTWRLKCRPNYWYVAYNVMDFNAEEEDPDLPWQCPDRGWRVKFDDASAPWWKWRKLEKFWVDANFFYGSIPDFIADKWPRLRTIDLYNNALTGTIPLALGRLTDLTQIQLQDNDLEGTVPGEVLHLPKLIKLRVAKNARLYGDIMVDEMAEIKGRLQVTPLALNYQHTGIRLCRGRVRAPATARRRARAWADRHLRKLQDAKDKNAPPNSLHCTYPEGYTRNPDSEGGM